MNRRRFLAVGAVGLAVVGGLGHRRIWTNGRRADAPPQSRNSIHPFLHATLEAGWRFGYLFATLTIENRSPSEMGLVDENHLPIRGELANSPFEEVGDRLVYTGPYEKRRASKRADCIQLSPGEHETFSVNLSRYYQIPMFTALGVFYEAFHSPEEVEGPLLLRSNVVEIDT